MPPPDKAAVAAELEALQLEELRDRVETIRNHRESKRRRIAARDGDLKAAMRRQEAAQAACWHKKGGKGVEMLSRGTDNYYAVVKHQLCHGPIIVVCQRCGKVWEPPPLALNRKGASIENKAEYKRLYVEYVKAIEFPTDNLMSGTQLFQITDNRDAA
jgi:hypothetical protein